MRHKLAMVADGKFTPEALRVLVSIQDEVAEQVAKSKSAELTALEASDREDQIGDWLEDHGIVSAWDYAPTFVEAGLDTDWLERVSASVDDVDASASLQSAIGWLKYTIDTRAADERDRRGQQAHLGAAGRGQAVLADGPRREYQSADVHELLHSTMMMFGDKIGTGKGTVKLVKDMDKSLPELLCYPGDLNQVWTNIIDNAIQAMDGHGTLTIRTARENERDDPRGDLRRRTRHPRGHHRPHLHPVLHHQAVRRGHRPRAWISRGASSSRSTTAISGASPSRATPASSCCLPLVAPAPLASTPTRAFGARRIGRNSRRRAVGWSDHDGHDSSPWIFGQVLITRPRHIRLIRHACGSTDPAAVRRKSRRWVTARSGPAAPRPPSWPG